MFRSWLLICLEWPVKIVSEYIDKSIDRMEFDREMFIRKLSTPLLQILCKTILNFQVLVKGMIDPDDIFRSSGMNR